MILGLTGSYGSGKSTVAEMIRELGGVLIDADQIAREVVAPGTPALEEIQQFFGPGALKPDGTLDRAAVAAIVFSDPEKRRRLETIIHPRVRRRELELLEANHNQPLVVLNVPLLFENHLEGYCDLICVVTVNEEERERRLKQRDNAAPEQIRQRLQTQMPQKEKVARANYIIDNSGGIEQTRLQVEQMVQQILSQ